MMFGDYFLTSIRPEKAQVSFGNLGRAFFIDDRLYDGDRMIGDYAGRRYHHIKFICADFIGNQERFVFERQ